MITTHRITPIILMTVILATTLLTYPNVKSQPVIKSVKLFYAGKMSDGIEYEIWEVLGRTQQSLDAG